MDGSTFFAQVNICQTASEPEAQKLRPSRIRVEKMKKTLKLMAMLLCVAAVATLSSCSKDNEDLIIGKWEVVKCTKTENGNVEELNSQIGKIWEFKTGGVLSCDGNNTTYSISGNDIILMGGLFSGTITTLTKSKLVLDYSYASNTKTRHYEFKKI